MASAGRWGVGGREYGNEWQVTKVMVNQKIDHTDGMKIFVT